MTMLSGFTQIAVRSIARPIRLGIVCLAPIVVSLGCNDVKTPPASIEAPIRRIKAYSSHVVATRSYDETVDMLGSSVHGMETTPVYAKLGGFVESIEAAADGDVIDLGSRVEAGQLLAVLDAPEMADEIRVMKAGVDLAQGVLRQRAADIVQAKADLASVQTGINKAAAIKVEKEAVVEARATEVRRFRDLVARKAARADVLEQAEAEYKAAAAASSAVDAVIASARAAVTAAEARVSKSEVDLDIAKAQLAVAVASQEQAETRINYLQIKAPFSGVVTKRNVDHGEFVQPASSNSNAAPLFEVTRVDQLRIVGSAPMNNASQMKIGQSLRYHKIGGLPGVVVNATVTRTMSVLDKNSRMLRVEAHVDNPVTDSASEEAILLTPGMFGTATVVVKHWGSLPVVPTTAIARDASGSPYVMVVQRNKARRRPVKIVFNDAIDVGVTGVAAGDRVITSDVVGLEEGQAVDIAAED